jgi:hypothetical protein
MDKLNKTKIKSIIKMLNDYKRNEEEHRANNINHITSAINYLETLINEANND